MALLIISQKNELIYYFNRQLIHIKLTTTAMKKISRNEAVNPHFRKYKSAKSFIHKFDGAVKNLDTIVLEERIIRSQAASFKLLVLFNQFLDNYSKRVLTQALDTHPRLQHTANHLRNIFDRLSF